MIGQTAAVTNVLVGRIQSTIAGYEQARLGLRDAIGMVQQAAAYCVLHDVRMAHHEEPQLAMHLLASVPNGGYVECFPNPARDPLWASLIANRPRIEDGLIYLPQWPGFGLEFDPDVIKRHDVDR